MAGVAYRHIALEEQGKGKSVYVVIEDLKRSTELLEKSGDSHELALSAIALSKAYLKIDEKKDAKKYADLAWGLLAKKDYSEFPAELVQYVDAEVHVSNLETLLNTQWLELRHIVNEERLAIRILTNLCRDMRMEYGAFFYVKCGSLEIQCTQNIERDMKNPQLLRAEAIAAATLNDKVIFVNTGRNNQPMMSMGIPFLHEGRVAAVIYMESYLEYRKVTEEECMLVADFAKKVSDTIVTAVEYTERLSGDDIENNIEFAETMRTDSTYCRSMDENVKFIGDLISKVAMTNIPVLITGETGVGKEVFAREVFEKSNYKKAFIKVNCGAIPDNLIESELFGYEKGSFTGAAGRKKGYFEVAEGGTVFLDEIGELPVIAQVKLLRVLQEHEIMRVGGTESVKVDFRLIVATNKNLAEEVKKGYFRNDLFYRLNVVQLQIPALRDRKKDIPVFGKFFLDKYSREFGKKCDKIDSQSLIEMVNYPWPGNVRELENTIQKAVLFSEGEIIRVEVPSIASERERENVKPDVGIEQEMIHESISVEQFFENQKILSLREMESQYIKKVLSLCGGKISGKGGAAEALGMKRTTLISKMKKLGIDKN